jgi:hypothetical protein
MPDRRTPHRTKDPPFDLNGGVSLKWIERELNRLDHSKVDRAFYTPELDNVKNRLSEILGMMTSMKQDLTNDIEEALAHADMAIKRATNHPCAHVERIDIMEKAVGFWSTWFLRGLIGLILLLLSAGGGWVYSYVHLEEAAKQTMEVSKELQREMDSVVEAQHQQREEIIRFQNAGLSQKDVENALNTALTKALEEKKIRH